MGVMCICVCVAGPQSKNTPLPVGGQLEGADSETTADNHGVGRLGTLQISR